VSESDGEPPNSIAAPPARLLLQAAAFGAVYLIWGSTYLAIRVGVQSLPPFLMAGARFLLAGAVLFLILRASGVAPPTRAQWVRSSLAGVVMLAVGNGLVTWAEQEVPSNLAALLISAVPLYVALIEWLRPRGTRPRVHQVAGIALGAAGMLFLVWPDPGALYAPSAAGVIAILVSGLAWASGSLYARYSDHHPNPLMAAAQQMLAGAVVLLAVGLFRGEGSAVALASITWTGVAAFLYLTIFGSLVAFSAFGWLLTVSTPSRLSTTAFVNPVVAVILGWAILGERLDGRAMAGAVLIVCAVVVMTVGLRPLRVPLELLRGRRLSDSSH
jgi:drug/metabolite transporter (DMT)-like permease